MPRSLTLVRHGESEGNLVRTLYEQGNAHPNEPGVMSVHTSHRRLTPKGVEQAKSAGVWLQKHWLGPLEEEDAPRMYVSPYVRAFETAANLGFGDQWYMDNRIVERNWGDLDMLTYDERMRKFNDVIDERDDDAFYWRPPGGETLQDVFQRTRDMTTTLHRECKDKHVLIVCHGETMWVWRALLEYWTSHDLTKAQRERTDKTRNINCRIIQYSRFSDAGEDTGKLSRVRFVNPSFPDDPRWNQDWTPIIRPTFTHSQLFEMAENFERFL